MNFSMFNQVAFFFFAHQPGKTRKWGQYIDQVRSGFFLPPCRKIIDKREHVTRFLKHLFSKLQPYRFSHSNSKETIGGVQNSSESECPTFEIKYFIKICSPVLSGFQVVRFMREKLKKTPGSPLSSSGPCQF